VTEPSAAGQEGGEGVDEGFGEGGVGGERWCGGVSWVGERWGVCGWGEEGAGGSVGVLEVGGGFGVLRGWRGVS